MQIQPDESVATHSWPIWRDSANFIFVASLEAKNGKNQWEQLWGKQLAPHRFIVCCIPFFLYDVALGDEVETDDDLVLQRVVHQSGQVTFRVWFGGQDASTRLQQVREIEEIGPLTEWSSEHLLALSVAESEAHRLANHLQRRENEGLLVYETGRR